MPYRAVNPDELVWETRPHEPDEPPRHVAELSEALNARHARSNVWRYEPGARGRRHVHADQEETFVVLDGTLTMYLGEPPERVELPAGGVVTVAGGTPLQAANHGTDDAVVYVHGYPPDDGASVIASAI